VTTVQRYGRVGRWFHAGIYLTVLSLLATGWWFVLAGYDHASPISALTGRGDGELHELAGYGMALVIVVWLPFGARGVARFARETLRYRRGDGRWLAGFPKAAFTGRFPHHDGHFDPGQRLANIVMVLTLATLVLTGLGMLWLDLPYMYEVHRWTNFLATPVILGHIVVASGILPGYRGVWRSMHLGGRLPVEVAERIWPSEAPASTAAQPLRQPDRHD
jgi:formate dehydrogenase subunit gamma